MKKKLFLSLIISLMFLISDCTKNSKITTDEVALWMNEKYNDTFTLTSSDNQLWTKDYSEMIFTSEKLNADIVVWVYSDKSFVDNYMAVKYKKQVENFILPLAKNIYGECKIVNIPIHYGKKHFNNDLSFNDYISNIKSSIVVDIATDSDFSLAKQDIEKLATEFKKYNIISDISISYYDDIKNVEITDNGYEPFSILPKNRVSASMNSDYTLKILN